MFECPSERDSSPPRPASGSPEPKKDLSSLTGDVGALNDAITKLKNENETLKAGMWKQQQEPSSSFGVMTIIFIVLALILGVLVGKMVL
ncbi:hypothetical protein BSL78_28016 [Apostichopus japonicus]|uniref:Uncharacterized protein n=1 Tax=Stichopus japonicus TaxID=307972 RepID=A0A2G8JHD6_STIJA|nr:hypothetical protein BSL78_28016 [Apostichopus japonicus]